MKKLISHFQMWLIEQSTQQTQDYITKSVPPRSGAVTTKQAKVLTVTYAEVQAARLILKRNTERNIPTKNSIHDIANAHLVFHDGGSSTWEVVVL